MIRFLSLLLILFFAITVLFGSAGMVLHMGGSGLPCAASMLGGTVCPTDQILFAMHHLGTYEILSRTAPIFASLSFIFLILVLAGRSSLNILFKPVFRSLYPRSGKEKKSVHSERLTKWLSLFELSPSF